jgi:tetratricopeptide (TPR) repeat protein/predicted Ser/Thr protein kinase
MSGMERIGPFVLQEQLGQGGMGAVFRAADARGGPEVALKLLTSPDERARRRLVLEARALTRLRHENVVSIVDAGEDRGRAFIALELVRGRSLQERLDREGPLPPREAARVVHAVARGLAHAHREGVLHRDLKPANVLLPDDGGAPRLADFGLAGFTFDLSQSRLTKSGTLMGTPGYWSPEQASGEVSKVGPATDVYGLGALLYAALTGRPPIAGASLMEILEATKRRPDPPKKDAVLDALALRCLEKDPADRPPSADAVARELARFLAGRVRRGSRRTPLVVAGASLGLVAIVVGVVAATRPARDEVVVAPIAPPSTPSEAPPPPAEPPPSQPPPKQAPPALAALLDRANAQLGSGQPRAALETLDRALALDPAFAATHRLRGLALALGGDLRAGLAALDQAVALAPEDAVTLTDRASVRVELHDLRGALADLDRAVALGPPLALTLIGRGRVRGQMGDPAGALADLDQALVLEPESAAAFAVRSLLKATDLGDRAGAIADMEAALRLEPEGQRSAALRRDLRTLQAHPELTPREALELEDEVSALFAQADELIAGGRPADALPVFDRAVALDPRSGAAHVKRATARNETGDAQGALADCARALELDPQDAQAYVVRGVIWSDLGERARAVADLEQGLALAPDAASAPAIRKSLDELRAPPRSTTTTTRPASEVAAEVESLIRRALVHMQRRELAAAIALFDQALELDPTRVTALSKRGSAKAALQDGLGALADFDRAVALAPEDAALYVLRGTVKASLLDDREGAIADMEVGVRLEPAGPRVDRMREDLRCLKEHPELSARKAIELRDQVRRLLERADEHLAGDRYADALTLLDRAVALDPRSISAHVKRATARNGVEDVQGALADCARALELDPQDATAFLVRGVVWSDSGQPARAIADYEQALSLAPDAGWAPAIRRSVEALRAAAAR